MSKLREQPNSAKDSQEKKNKADSESRGVAPSKTFAFDAHQPVQKPMAPKREIGEPICTSEQELRQRNMEILAKMARGSHGESDRDRQRRKKRFNQGNMRAKL
jgi:hypothetical protein